MKKIICIGWISILLLSACSHSLPEDTVMQKVPVAIYPDYNEVTIPSNIAPLNFKIEEQADEYLTHIHSSKGEGMVISGQKVLIDDGDWRDLLAGNKGDTLYTEVYLKKGGQWMKYPAVKMFVAPEEIDRYISYRLIEPSYISYETMTINQRDLTNFEEEVIYENSLLSDGDNGQCVNCHSYQNYNKTGNMQLHIRQNLGGTLIVTGGNKAQKVNLKTSQTISAGVYPSWHPTGMLIAYSVNSTGQDFHTKDIQKVEVLDYESDLILYDVDKNEVMNVANDKDEFETYPSWSTDGKLLYYVSAHYPQQTDNIDAELSMNYKQLKYNIYRKPFDLHTRTFGATDTVFKASEYGKSATLPRESPDGKYLLFSMGDYGNFHIWHKSSDLYLMNLATKEVRALKELNSPDVESYHSWSSNGRWIIFSSRRDDGSYTRPYIAYFDKSGKAHRPFILPQKSPDYYERLFKSYNIPEFMVAPVTMSPNSFRKVIEKDPVNAVFHGVSNNMEKQSGSEKGDFYK